MYSNAARLARTGSVAHADEKATLLAPAHPLDLLVERRRLRRVPRQADRQAVATVGSQSLGLVEAQRGTGRVDQEVVMHVRSRAVHALGNHVRRWIVTFALRVDLPRGSLHELDPRPLRATARWRSATRSSGASPSVPIRHRRYRGHLTACPPRPLGAHADGRTAVEATAVEATPALTTTGA
jgi:hypothetical protein